MDRESYLKGVAEGARMMRESLIQAARENRRSNSLSAALTAFSLRLGGELGVEFLDACRVIDTHRKIVTTSKLCRMTEPAHCMDDDFRKCLSELGVKVVDGSGAPYEVVFEGTRAALEALLGNEWGYCGKDLEIAKAGIEEAP